MSKRGKKSLKRKPKKQNPLKDLGRQKSRRQQKSERLKVMLDNTAKALKERNRLFADYGLAFAHEEARRHHHIFTLFLLPHYPNAETRKRLINRIMTARPKVHDPEFADAVNLIRHHLQVVRSENQKLLAARSLQRTGNS